MRITLDEASIASDPQSLNNSSFITMLLTQLKVRLCLNFRARKTIVLNYRTINAWLYIWVKWISVVIQVIISQTQIFWFFINNFCSFFLFPSPSITLTSIFVLWTKKSQWLSNFLRYSEKYILNHYYTRAHTQNWQKFLDTIFITYDTPTNS